MRYRVQVASLLIAALLCIGIQQDIIEHLYSASEVSSNVRSAPEASWGRQTSGFSSENVTSRVTASETKEDCNTTVPLISRRIQVNLTVPELDEMVTLTHHLQPGGRFKPQDCLNPAKVAIIVPYRNRESQLRVFLRHMHPFLQRQRIQYGVFIVEMVGGVKFNRAMLMNIGYVESSRRDRYECFVFHDVDLLPEDDANQYG